ncbi:hypothetical protein [Acanthopleuribacter pedis]|uniref:DUF4142 domain-containing protein n=1 Tax=Acanthopleuribacter pedis TaxID=442870 RepID=A0A8J7QQD8_9BACT|nr:hypothetical protein [Acanthopleuribacter pedis]MBO1322955.1 hypothetical protein [Acanthopleuribacter pedis]
MKSPLLALFLLFLPGFFTPVSAFDREEGTALVAHLVKRQPANREIMFVEMLFSSSHRDLFFDNKSLDGLAKMLRKTRDKRFQRDFDADAKYRSWLLSNLEELKAYNDSKQDDLVGVALRMNDASLEMNDRLNNLNKRNLLYLIQYAARLPMKQTLSEEPFVISVGQLLPVLRAEYNSRK